MPKAQEMAFAQFKVSKFPGGKVGGSSAPPIKYDYVLASVSTITSGQNYRSRSHSRGHTPKKLFEFAPLNVSICKNVTVGVLSHILSILIGCLASKYETFTS